MEGSNEINEISGLCFGTRGLHPGPQQHADLSFFSDFAQPLHYRAGAASKKADFFSEAD
jgi:hypothetical protein